MFNLMYLRDARDFNPFVSSSSSLFQCCTQAATIKRYEHSSFSLPGVQKGNEMFQIRQWLQRKEHSRQPDPRKIECMRSHSWSSQELLSAKKAPGNILIPLIPGTKRKLSYGVKWLKRYNVSSPWSSPCARRTLVSPSLTETKEQKHLSLNLALACAIVFHAFMTEGAKLSWLSPLRHTLKQSLI